MATPQKRLTERLAPLDPEHQRAFVLSVRDLARAVIFLSLGVVLGVLAAWINGIGRKKKA